MVQVWTRREVDGLLSNSAEAGYVYGLGMFHNLEDDFSCL